MKLYESIKRRKESIDFNFLEIKLEIPDVYIILSALDNVPEYDKIKAQRVQERIHRTLANKYQRVDGLINGEVII